VVEVTYDHFTGDRFRHGTRIVRWRKDKAPKQCTMDQVAHREGRAIALFIMCHPERSRGIPLRELKANFIGIPRLRSDDRYRLLGVQREVDVHVVMPAVSDSVGKSIHPRHFFPKRLD